MRKTTFSLESPFMVLTIIASLSLNANGISGLGFTVSLADSLFAGLTVQLSEENFIF